MDNFQFNIKKKNKNNETLFKFNHLFRRFEVYTFIFKNLNIKIINLTNKNMEYFL